MAVSAAVVSESQGSSSHAAQHLTCGKHEEIPEAFPLPTEVDIVRAAAGWAHCIAATAFGEVYTWGLKECIPLGKVIRDHLGGGSLEKDDEHTRSFNGQASPITVDPGSHVARTSRVVPGIDSRGGNENTKRRRLSSAKQGVENLTSCVESMVVVPRLVILNMGVKIVAVAAGGRHTLALSDTGAVLTFGWGLYGQCGLGNTDDELTPLCVSSLLGVKMRGIAAGSWHTVCAFGGNQFGQLGTGSDQAEHQMLQLSRNQVKQNHLRSAEIMGRYSIGDGTNMASSAWVMLSTGLHHLMSPSRPAILHMWPVVGGTHSYLQSLPPESDSPPPPLMRSPLLQKFC